MIKKNKNLTTLCIILGLIIVLLLGYIVGTSVNNQNKEPNKTNKNETVEKEFDIKKAKVLLEEFGFNRRKGCKTIVQNEYNDTYKAIVALEKVAKDKIIEENCTDLFSITKLEANPEPLFKGDTGVCMKDAKAKTITYNDVNEIYKKMYGEDISPENINALSINSQDYALYDFLEGRDLFVKLDCYGCGGTCYSKHIREIKSATQNDNIVTITIYDYESDGVTVEDGIFKFSTEKISENIECQTDNQCINIIKKDYLEYLNQYEIKFEIIDNQFIFKSLNKVVD